jgi:hypothetical protein
MFFCVFVVILGVAAVGEAQSITLMPALLVGSWLSCTIYALSMVLRALAIVSPARKTAARGETNHGRSMQSIRH